MKEDLIVQPGVIIPLHEIEITTSRSGGPGGQHVNKTSTRITLRWNVKNTTALTDEQKARVIEKLQSSLTTEGDLIVHNSASRSQLQNKENALEYLALKIRNALHISKKRMKARISQSVKERRLDTKKKHSELKKMRREKIQYD